MNNKKELHEILEKAGVEFSKRWGEARLKTVIVENGLDLPLPESPMSEEGKKEIVKGLEEFVSSIPLGERTKYSFVLNCEEKDVCQVFKIAKSNREEFVREYSKEIHGDKYEDLAKSFVEKNNNK